MYMYDIYIYIYIYTRNTKNSSTYFSPSGAISVLCAGSGRGGRRVIPRWYTGFLAEELPSPPSSPSPPSAPSSSLSSSSASSSSVRARSSQGSSQRGSVDCLGASGASDCTGGVRCSGASDCTGGVRCSGASDCAADCL